MAIYKDIYSADELSKLLRDCPETGNIRYHDGEQLKRYLILPYGIFMAAETGNEDQPFDKLSFHWKDDSFTWNGSDHISKDNLFPKIPWQLLCKVVTEFRKDLDNEDILMVYYDLNERRYFLHRPLVSARSKVYLEYDEPYQLDMDPALVRVLTVHSHNTMRAGFSLTDDGDELRRIGLFGIFGRLNLRNPQCCLRACMGGESIHLSIHDLVE